MSTYKLPCGCIVLDAALTGLAAELRHIDARLTLSTDIDPQALSLESKLRASQFRARVRQTLKELEISKCKTSI
jgi:hypothetical protein